jgi:hypothetical protein
MCVGMYVCVWGCRCVCWGVCMCVGMYVFTKFFSSENDSDRNSEVFSLPKMIQNGIPRFFSSAKQAEFRRNYRLFRLVPY